MGTAEFDIKMVKLILFSILYFSVALLQTASEDDGGEDGFFCKIEEEKFRICRRCPDVEENQKCPNDEEGCRCDNIELFDNGEFMGGSNCDGGFCFVSSEKRRSEEGGCDDVDYDTEDYEAQLLIDDINDYTEFWHEFDRDIVRSEEACENTEKISIGNKKVLQGIRITKDFIFGVKETIDDNGILTVEEDEKSPYMIYVDDYKECIQECKDLCGKCGAWSFDDTWGKCFLHTVDACCGQKLKQETESNFISGYYCNYCWSTKKDCPCTLKDRLKPYPKKCKGVTEFATGAGETPQLTSSAGLLEVHSIPVNRDTCACENRKFTRRGRSKCRCVKPQCKDKILNPDGICEDRRRCRSRQYNMKRFPFC